MTRFSATAGPTDRQPEPRETRSVLYSPFGDPILHVPDHAEALAYAREVKGRTLEVIVETTSRTALPVEAARSTGDRDEIPGKPDESLNP